MSKYFFALLLSLITSGAMAESCGASTNVAKGCEDAPQKSSAAKAEESCSCCQG